MVRASRFGGAALLVGVLCLATCTTRVGGDYVQPVANPGDEPGQVLPVDLDTGMPMVPPAFPPSFVARVAFRRQTSERVRLPLQRSTYGTRHVLVMMMMSCLV